MSWLVVAERVSKFIFNYIIIHYQEQPCHSYNAYYLNLFMLHVFN